MKLNDLGTKYLEFDNDANTFNIIVEGEVIKTVIGKSSAEKYSASLQRKGISAIIEAEEPKADTSARAKLDHSLRSQGHQVQKDKKKELKKGTVKHKGKAFEELRDIEIGGTKHKIIVKVGKDKSYTLFIDGKKIGEYYSMGQAKKAIPKEIKNESTLAEGPLVLTRTSDLLRMLDTLLDSWKSKDHTDEEMAQLLKALGYKMDKKGERTVLVQEAACPACAGRGHKPAAGDMDRPCDVCDGTGNQQIEEAPGAIRKGMAAVALIAGLWGVNNQLAQQAYDASPQLQKLTAYLEVAKEHNDRRMIDQLEQRIENHKTRLDLGKGEVMGKDGMPIDVKYDKDVDEAKQRLDPKCWKGYKKQGTKMKGGVRVNNCVPK